MQRERVRSHVASAFQRNKSSQDLLARLKQLIMIITFLIAAISTSHHTGRDGMFTVVNRIDNMRQQDRQAIITQELLRSGITDPTGHDRDSKSPHAPEVPYRRKRQRRWSGPDEIVRRNAQHLASMLSSPADRVNLLTKRESALIDPHVYEYIAAAKAEHPGISMTSVKNDPTWNDAIAREQDVIARSGTWTDWQALPIGTTSLRAMFVLKVKRDGRKKARCVACGNQQARTAGEQNYSPATSGTIVRTLIAISQMMPGSTAGTLDCDEAFMQSKLSQLIAIHLPTDWRHDLSPVIINGTTYVPGQSNMRPMLLLERSIYGLRAAPREWIAHLNSGMKLSGAIRSSTDNTTYAIYDGPTKPPDELPTVQPEALQPPGTKPAKKIGKVRFTVRVPSERARALACRRKDAPIALLTIYVDDLFIIAASKDDFMRTITIIRSLVKAKMPDIIQAANGQEHASPVDFLGIAHVRMQNGDISATIEDCRSKLSNFAQEPRTKVPCPARVIQATDEAATATNKYKPGEGRAPWRTYTGIIQYLADAMLPQVKYAAWQLGKVSADPRDAHAHAMTTAVGYVQQYMPTLTFPVLFSRHATHQDEIDIALSTTALWYDYSGDDMSGHRMSALPWSTRYPSRPRPIQVRAFADSDWAGEPNGASTSAFVIMLDQDACMLPRVSLDKQQRQLHMPEIPSTSDPWALQANRGSLLSWNSKRQAGLPALSSAEAELHALVAATKQVLYITQALIEFRPFHMRDIMPPIVHGDNQAANGLVMRTNVSRTRHSSLRISWARAYYESMLGFVGKVNTKHNVADLLTKPHAHGGFNDRWQAVNMNITSHGPTPPYRSNMKVATSRIASWLQASDARPETRPPRPSRGEKRAQRVGGMSV